MLTIQKGQRLKGTPTDRFWLRVVKSPGCWDWQGSVDTAGYGQMSVENRRTERASRISWRIHFGEIPTGLCVLHRCDNRRCSRPDHLFLGTRADNAADMVAKGRQAKGDRSSSRLYPERRPRGEKHPHSKLDVATVLEIRRLHATGIGKRKLGKRFGVNERTILAILRGKTWTHVSSAALESGKF